MRNYHAPAGAYKSTYNVKSITFADEPPRPAKLARPRPDSNRTGLVMVRCLYCETTTRMEMPEHSAALWSFRFEHADSCERFRQAINCEQGRLSEREWARRRISFIGQAFDVEVITHKRRPDRALTQCGPACRNATGGDCDCRCEGKLHGINHDATAGRLRLVLAGEQPT